MPLEQLGLAERDRWRPKDRERSRVALQHGSALHEIEHSESRGETRRARSRQHMIGAADVIADRLRRMRPEEDRASVVDFRRKRLGVARHDLEVLRSEPLDQRQGGLELRAQDDRAIIAPARAGDLFARQRGELPLDLGRGCAGECAGVGDEDGLRGFVMLRLRKQVGRDEARIGARNQRG